MKPEELREELTKGLLAQRQDHERSEERAGYVWLSEVGYCPFKAALKRNDIPPIMPMTDMQLAEQQIKFAVANFAAEQVQNALSGWMVAEYPVVDHELKVSGRVDLVLWSEKVIPAEIFCEAIYEIKCTRRAQPNIGQVLQAMGYRLLMKARSSYIILLNPFGSYAIWALVPEGDGFKVISEQGEDWKSPLNTPAILNYDLLRREIQRHRDYQEYVASQERLELSDMPNLAPHTIDDPDRGWMCARVVDEPKRYVKKYTYHKGQPDERAYGAGDVRPGEAIASCEWFCHGPSTMMEVTLDENDRLVFTPKEVSDETLQPEGELGF